MKMMFAQLKGINVQIARVVGNVVSTIKHHTNEGLKLMIIQPIDGFGNPHGKQKIAIDTACAGEGDIVLLTDEGGASRMMVGEGDAAVDAVIVGVLDNLPYK
jgi:microcompartment protein CcmK/EutM